MASYVSDYGLNFAADLITDRDIEVRIHDGAPGNAGANNRIGSVAVTLLGASFGSASGGISETLTDTYFGVLDSTNSHDVEAYSLWIGGNFYSWADVYQPNTTIIGVTVDVGESFTINAGTIEIRAAR